MMRILLTLLFIIFPMNALASDCDSTDYPPNNLAFKWDCAEKDWWKTITSGLGNDDKVECPIFGSGHNFHSFTKTSMTVWDKWVYKTTDDFGISGVCRRGMPTINEMFYIQREGENTADAIYTVGTAYCKARNISEAGEGAADVGLAILTLGVSEAVGGLTNIDTRRDGYCTLGDDEVFTGYTDGSTITFNPGEIVDLESSDGYKYMGLAPVCLIHYKKGDTYRHDHSPTIHASTVNNVCAYLAVAGFASCTSHYGLSWNHALIGCVQEPPYPGPDVMNSVIPAQLAPYVDYSFCLDPQGTGPIGCNKNKDDSLIERGSTFDRPVIILNGGDDGGTMALQYSFKSDTDPDGKDIQRCGKFSSELGFSSSEYCAQVPKEKPHKVCACLKRDDGLTETDGYIDYCGENKPIGCTDRPTLEHSNLKLVAEFEALSEYGKKHAAVRPVFVRTNDSGDILYIDASGDDICINVAGSEEDGDKYYKCNSDGITPSNRPPTGELTYKERLKLPLDSIDSIREFHLNIPNPDYTCKDEDNSPVRLDEDGKFYKYINGRITNGPAKGKASCENFKIPPGYLSPKTAVYGVTFSAAIAEEDSGDIRFGRFTSDRDEPPTNKVCTPIQMTTICDTQGTINFYPDGERSTTFCFPPNLDNCGQWDKGDHEDEALRLYCPGAYLGPTSPDQPANICILPSTNWYFETKEEYANNVNLSGSLAKYAADCDRKVDYADKCVPIDLGCRQIDVPTEESAYAKWDEMETGEQQTGNCDWNAGYTIFKKVSYNISHFNRTKDEICAMKKDEFAAVSCDDHYANYVRDAKDIGDTIEAEILTSYNNLHNHPVNRYVELAAPLYGKYVIWRDIPGEVGNRGLIGLSFAVNPPKKTCELGGGSSDLEYHCVKKQRDPAHPWPDMMEPSHSGFDRGQNRYEFPPEILAQYGMN